MYFKLIQLISVQYENYEKLWIYCDIGKKQSIGMVGETGSDTCHLRGISIILNSTPPYTFMSKFSLTVNDHVPFFSRTSTSLSFPCETLPLLRDPSSTARPFLYCDTLPLIAVTQGRIEKNRKISTENGYLLLELNVPRLTRKFLSRGVQRPLASRPFFQGKKL